QVSDRLATLRKRRITIDNFNHLRREQQRIQSPHHHQRQHQLQRQTEKQWEYQEKSLNNGKVAKTIGATTNNKKFNLIRSFFPNTKQVSDRLATLRKRRITIAHFNDLGRVEQRHQSPQICSNETKESLNNNNNNNSNNNRVEQNLKKPENFHCYISYQPTVDIQDLIQLDDAMEDEELRYEPNGGHVFSLEFLIENEEWLKSQLIGADPDNELSTYPDDAYILFDMPGQIELFTL
uniref:GPN-loop GTPase 3 n=1 Tax=Glossina palpalis gambiensis TaxID=67801 RepID=A0A1B0BMZ4_9MUSC